MMKKLKKFEVILDDGSNVLRIHTVGESAKSVSKTLEGNGEIVRIKEVPDILPSAAIVRDTLKNSGYGDAECDIVYRLLYQYLDGTSES